MGCRWAWLTEWMTVWVNRLFQGADWFQHPSLDFKRLASSSSCRLFSLYFEWDCQPKCFCVKCILNKPSNSLGSLFERSLIFHVAQGFPLGDVVTVFIITLSLMFSDWYLFTHMCIYYLELDFQFNRCLVWDKGGGKGDNIIWSGCHQPFSVS